MAFNFFFFFFIFFCCGCCSSLAIRLCSFSVASSSSTDDGTEDVDASGAVTSIRDRLGALGFPSIPVFTSIDVSTVEPSSFPFAKSPTTTPLPTPTTSDRLTTVPKSTSNPPRTKTPPSSLAHLSKTAQYASPSLSASASLAPLTRSSSSSARLASSPSLCAPSSAKCEDSPVRPHTRAKMPRRTRPSGAYCVEAMRWVKAACQVGRRW